MTFSGRVEAYCPGARLLDDLDRGARSRITRPSRFPGGPGFGSSRSSKAGIARGTDSFSISLPRTHDGDPPYTVTIDPDGGGDSRADGRNEPARARAADALRAVASTR